MSDSMRFDELVIKLLSSSLEASASYRKAIEEAQAAGREDVVTFLTNAKTQDQQRALQAMEIVQGFFRNRLW